MNNYQAYATLDFQIKELTLKKEELKNKILSEMSEKGEIKVESDFGKFTVSKLKRWTYTEKVTELEEKFKTEKAKEESNGMATYEEQDSLRFTQNKL